MKTETKKIPILFVIGEGNFFFRKFGSLHLHTYINQKTTQFYQAH